MRELHRGLETFVEELHLAEVTHTDVEILRLPYQAGEDDLGEDGED